MSIWRDRARSPIATLAAWSAITAFTACTVLTASVAFAQPAAAPAYPGIGRPATPQEVQAWDIDVRPDFKGLPVGSGSVARGMVVWEAQCASCHGIFGESNEVFSPLVGGTTGADIQTGHVARLNDPAYPGRTTLMKAATLSTLWDYIRRAMPWNAPKSLSTDDVYAVTAYLLNLGEVLPSDFVLSNRNMAQAQARLPNRNGMTTLHGLWPGKDLGGSRGPDVRSAACMKDCAVDTKVASHMPDFARDAHGNLAEQNRSFGAQVGATTARTAPPAASAASSASAVAPAVVASTDKGTPPAVMKLLQSHNCLACHGLERALVGPGFNAVADKYASRSDAAAHLAGRIRGGSSGVWGAIAMPAQNLSEADAQTLATWLATGAKR